MCFPVGEPWVGRCQWPRGQLSQSPTCSAPGLMYFKSLPINAHKTRWRSKGPSKGQPTSVAQSFGVRCIHTFAWDVGILVSRRNWNIPRITWSIIPIVQEFQGGHAITKKKNNILGPIQSRGGKSGGLSGRSPISLPRIRGRNAVVTLRSPFLDTTPTVASSGFQ